MQQLQIYKGGLRVRPCTHLSHDALVELELAFGSFADRDLKWTLWNVFHMHPQSFQKFCMYVHERCICSRADQIYLRVRNFNSYVSSLAWHCQGWEEDFWQEVY